MTFTFYRHYAYQIAHEILVRNSKTYGGFSEGSETTWLSSSVKQTPVEHKILTKK